MPEGSDRIEIAIVMKKIEDLDEVVRKVDKDLAVLSREMHDHRERALENAAMVSKTFLRFQHILDGINGAPGLITLADRSRRDVGGLKVQIRCIWLAVAGFASKVLFDWWTH